MLNQNGKVKWLIISILVVIVIALIVGSTLLFLARYRPNATNPFTTNILVTTKFTLYYPTNLPEGYYIDANSVSTPQTGVVILDIQNSRNQKIYMSQEARPSEFNFGGYYKDFSGLNEQVTSQGTIATGYINNHQTVVGSLLINGTWVFLNTNNLKIHPSSLSRILRSLIASQ